MRVLLALWLGKLSIIILCWCVDAFGSLLPLAFLEPERMDSCASVWLSLHDYSTDHFGRLRGQFPLLIENSAPVWHHWQTVRGAATTAPRTSLP